MRKIGFAPLDKNKNLERKYLTGLTLIEIIVSTVLVALVLTGVANLYVVGKRYITHSRARMTGGEVGKLFLDPLQMQVRQDGWSSNCLGSGAGCPGYQDVGPIRYTPAYSIDNVVIGNCAGTAADPCPRRVRLTISWSEPAVAP